MARWDESNRAVACDFLSERVWPAVPDAAQDHNTTTQQRFDPARLDQFVTLLELPAGVARPNSADLAL